MIATIRSLLGVLLLSAAWAAQAEKAAGAMPASRMAGPSTPPVVKAAPAAQAMPRLPGASAASPSASTTAPVYGLRPGADGVAELRFGDGITGRRPPSGSDNVDARYNSGADETYAPVSGRQGHEVSHVVQQKPPVQGTKALPFAGALTPLGGPAPSHGSTHRAAKDSDGKDR